MDDTTWALVEAERRTLADLLDQLTPEQWESQSLCDEWRIRDVAAHVAMTAAHAPSPSTMITALVRTRGHLWAAGRDVARDYARRSTADIVAELRGNAASRDKPGFVVADNILPDLLVHGQDIAVPLGIDRPIPPLAGVIALRRNWALRWPFHARRRLGGFALQADDCDWSAGEGPAITGSAAALLQLMTGRADAAIQRLQGPGVEAVRSRTSAPSSHSTTAGRSTTQGS